MRTQCRQIFPPKFIHIFTATLWLQECQKIFQKRIENVEYGKGYPEKGGIKLMLNLCMCRSNVYELNGACYVAFNIKYIRRINVKHAIVDFFVRFNIFLYFCFCICFHYISETKTLIAHPYRTTQCSFFHFLYVWIHCFQFFFFFLLVCKLRQPIICWVSV